MIYGNINNLGNKKAYNALILELLERLKSGEWDNFKNGKYEIKGNDIFIIISNYETSQEEEKKPEVHRKYIDIQYIFEGVELIKVATDIGNCDIYSQYNEENDIMFYTHARNESSLVMNKGDFAVFYPQDIHKPGCSYLEKSKIRKAVIKISMDI